MQTWKKAYQLAKFEWRASFANIFICWFVLTVFGLLFSTSFSGYLETNYAGFDIAFLLGFSFAPYLLRSNHFQYKKVSDHLYASPTLIMQTQLPIPKDIVAKSRLIIYLPYLLPFALTIFPILYIANSSVRDAMDAPAYIVFALIWVFYGLYMGIMLPASDAGDYVTPKIVVYYSLAAAAIFMGIITLFYLLFGHGIVAWTIILARDWPVPAIIISIILIFISWKYWPVHMKKTMKELDYL